MGRQIPRIQAGLFSPSSPFRDALVARRRCAAWQPEAMTVLSDRLVFRPRLAAVV